MPFGLAFISALSFLSLGWSKYHRYIYIYIYHHSRDSPLYPFQNCLGNGVFGLLSFFMPVLLRYCSRFFSVHLASFLTGELILAFLDVRWFLILGPTGYAAYILGLIYFQAQDKLAFPLVLGVYFGIGVSSGLPWLISRNWQVSQSAFTWVGTTYISVSYPTKTKKGHFINNQWVGLACGSMVGATIAFGSNFHKSKASGGEPFPFFPK